MKFSIGDLMDIFSHHNKVELKVLDNPYPVLTKVPQFVADWIISNDCDDKYIVLERFFVKYNRVELSTDLYNYYDNNHNGSRDKVISAILNGYVIEHSPS